GPGVNLGDWLAGVSAGHPGTPTAPRDDQPGSNRAGSTGTTGGLAGRYGPEVPKPGQAVAEHNEPRLGEDTHTGTPDGSRPGGVAPAPQGGNAPAAAPAPAPAPAPRNNNVQNYIDGGVSYVPKQYQSGWTGWTKGW